MKTFRMSASTENRNARMAIDFRGGGCRREATIPQEQQIAIGRRLRRAARSGKAKIDTFMTRDDGTLRLLPAGLGTDPNTTDFVRCSHATPPLAVLGFAVGDDA